MMFSLIFFSGFAQGIWNIFGNLAILIAYSEKKNFWFSFLKSGLGIYLGTSPF